MNIPWYKHPVKTWFVLGYGITFLLVLCGAIAQWLCSIEGALPHAGALIVIWGVFLTWKDYGGVLEKLEEIAVDTFENAGYTDVMPSDIGKKKFNKLDFIVLFIGTYVWGFGDLSFWYFILWLVLVIGFLYTLSVKVLGR